MGGGVMQSNSGGRRRRGRRRSEPLAEINITPFVDVMLVLLIIFMVAAPLSVVGVPVDLPNTAANSLSSDMEEPLTVTITATGEVTIQNTITALDELVAKLSAIASERTSDRIFLRADGANDWDTVAKIMGALNAGGFSNIGLVTDVGGPAFDGSDG